MITKEAIEAGWKAAPGLTMTQIERILTAARADGMEEAAMMLKADDLTKEASDFLLERDQQTTQDERDDGEREASAFIILQMGAAAIRAAMEKEE